MPSTYDLLKEANQFLFYSWELTPEEYEDALTTWLGHGDDKLERIAAWHAASKATVERDRVQADAYAASIKRSTAAMDRAKFLAGELLHMRVELGESPKVPGVARLQKNGGKAPLHLDADIVDHLPLELVIVTRTADTEAIRAALVAGVEVPGAAIGVPGFHVRFE